MDKDEAIKFCDWWTTIQPICVWIAQPLSDVDLMNAFLLASYSHHLIIPYLSTRHLNYSTTEMKSAIFTNDVS